MVGGVSGPSSPPGSPILSSRLRRSPLDVVMPYVAFSYSIKRFSQV